MKHKPNKNDVITDLRRCVMASFSPKNFEDENVQTFLKNAEDNLEKIKSSLREDAYVVAKQRIAKAKNPKVDLNKRREDLLTASCILS